MQDITRRELTELSRDGIGVVLVDHHARNAAKSSTLHAVTCRWAKMARGYTPLRFDTDDRAANRWLHRQRGEEGSAWRRCPECGGHSENAEPEPRRAVGATVWTTDRARDLGFVTGSDSERVQVAEFDS